MLYNGFVVEDSMVNVLNQYNMVKYGRPHTWGTKRLNVYKNINAPQANIDTDPNGIKYVVCTLNTEGQLACSSFFSFEKAEAYVVEILNGFIMHSNNILAIEINFSCKYSF